MWMLLTSLAWGGPFPTVSGYNLEGQEVVFPKELPGERTIVLMAFSRGQYSDIDTWLPWAKAHAKSHGSVDYVDVAVVGRMPSLLQGVINRGMASSIDTVEARSRTIPLYIRGDTITAPLSIDDDAVHIMVVDRSGTVHAVVRGPYTDAGAKKISAATTP